MYFLTFNQFIFYLQSAYDAPAPSTGEETQDAAAAQEEDDGQSLEELMKQMKGL